ncbi:aminotransferase class I/II-fold pyridoxal phosphate-dependent enzyme [Qipengyuania oceanensis]|uniref:GDP-perosamine synthase n=1 Tax=Qipengyuania oceanensis TaxID=1463597 RepID=A0A844YIF6_9SPHN|nr:aminotransferase class I/II-fold pyridoxal phosphate-dependent enzyme [Qipengyuania oceanensis]MXO63109.1 aminotransferase class I/II-fold pyridoxal phosphate-dependent enzyme [Qipengyuania oceanensis]
MAKIDDLVLTGAASLGDALQLIERTAKEVALVVDDDAKLVALLTDGDIRRLLLQDWTLGRSLRDLPERSPITACMPCSDAEAVGLLDRHKIDQLPIVDDNGRVIDLLLRRDLTEKIWLSTPHMGEDELQYVNQAFATNWIAPLGPNVDAFEKELAQFVGVQHGAALSSGTAAIHLALVLLGVGPGDRVICPSLTFVASANPVLYQGAEPIFVDVETGSWNICPLALERALAECKREGRLPKAVITVDLYGQAADYRSIVPICAAYGVPIVEDAAEALGAKLDGQACGSFGKIGIFSFNGNKIITTSGGGMLVADDPDLVARARKLSTQARDDAPWYEHSEVGYNYRMSNVLAGIGRGQLAKLEERVDKRREIFARYEQALADCTALTWMPEFDGSRSNRWLTTCLLNHSLDPQAVMQDLARLNIEARRVWKPMHLQPLFKQARFVSSNETSDVSADLFARGLCLPSGSNMTLDQVDRVAAALADAVSRQPSQA